MFDVQCAECGVATQVPFKPNGSRPVKCRDCFQGDRGGRDNRRNDRGGNRGGDREWKKSFDVTCDECGKETTVPFKPTGDRDVLCRACFTGDDDWQDEFEVECAECGVDTTVKFKPTGDRPVLCNDCFSAQKEKGFEVECHDCGITTTVPFKPTGDRPVRCTECFRNSRPQRDNRGGGGYNNRGGDRGGYNNRGGDRGGDRPSFDVTCAECGVATTVPFKPNGSRPVKCRDCFRR